MKTESWEAARASGVLSLIREDPELASLIAGEDAASVLTDINLVESKVKSLTTQASGNKDVLRWASVWEALVEEALTGGISESDLDRFGKKCEILKDTIQHGGWSKSLLSEFGSYENLTTISESNDSFVASFEKFWSVDVERHDSGGVGVVRIYLDATATRHVLAQIRTGWEMRKFLDETGYHCLRSGDVSDLEACSFGDRVSQWVFIDLDLKSKKK